MSQNRITFDFQSGEVIWETPEKKGRDDLLDARALRPLVFDILGEGEHDLRSLASFVNIVAKNDELSKAFYDALMAKDTESSAGTRENTFDGILKTVEIKATVLERTYQSIKGMMKESGGTMGDVIDKMSIRFSPSEPKLAIPLALEELGVCLSGLAPAEAKEAHMEIAATLMAAMTSEENKVVHEKAANKQSELAEALKLMNKTKLRKLTDSLKHLFGGQIG